MAFKTTQPFVEEPIVRAVEGGYREGETVTTHPAYAQISVSRSSGGHSTLYGSDFDHHARLTLKIMASELHRSLASDWHFSREEYIEVDLSEAQWATLVSSPNVGSGVPCTLSRRNGVHIPGIPQPKTRSAQFGAEMKGVIDAAMTEIDEAVAFVDTLGLSGKKADALKAKIASGGHRLRGTVPYLADRFDEHMEDTVEAAKTEVHGYMTGQIMRAGLTSLGGNPDVAMPLSLGGPDGETD